MAREINYVDRYSKEWERREAALNDLKEWLGKASYSNLCRVAVEERDKGTDRVTVHNSAALFLGISGYPVNVLLDFLGFPPSTPKTPSGTAQTQAKPSDVG